MRKEYYALAASEVANGEIDLALMIKAMTLADGEESRGRAKYITLRAEEIESLHRKMQIAAGVSSAVSAAGRVGGNALRSTAASATKSLGSTYNTGKYVVKETSFVIGEIVKLITYFCIAMLVLAAIMMAISIGSSEEAPSPITIEEASGFCGYQEDAAVSRLLGTGEFSLTCDDGSTATGNLNYPAGIIYTRIESAVSE